MRIYATTEELTTWLSPTPAPADAAGLLRSASGLIRSETKLAVYPVDTEGYATNTGTRAAFKDATCAQVKYWMDHKITPGLGLAGIKPAAVSKSIGGASITYESGATAAMVEALGGLAPDAHYILSDAGLLGGQPLVL